ncbi:MAG TPA: hypothetical protein VIM96_02940 [Pseudomonadales bacterium]
MNLNELTALLGWCSAINIGVLMLATLILGVYRHALMALHGRWFGLNERELQRAYFQYLANYKILIIVFNLVPYLVLRCAL